VRVVAAGLIAGLHALLALTGQLPVVLRALADLLRNLWRWLRLRKRRRRERCECCVELPPSVYRRPDPLLYSQSYLMAKGLAVTWDNPDIQLFRNGSPVASSGLLPDTEYVVQIRIWNGSFHAPAAGLPLFLSYLSFGAGVSSHPVGTAIVDLGVKGSAQCPAFAQVPWRTPVTAGHYCLQARLEWADDANPDNNLGQENVEVGVAHSPATFAFTVGNQVGIARRFEIEVDAYTVPGPRPCDDETWPPPPGSQRRGAAPSRLAESQARWSRVLQEQAYGMHSVGEEWSIAVDPAEFGLEAGQERQVQVGIEPTDPDFAGRQPFNLNVFATGPGQARRLVGGVTLYVERGDG
jgi:hypothetical protein